MGGVYANFANVSHSDYEFTVTFARVDHEVEADEVPGVVVTRVNLSPKFMRELIDAMQDNYSECQTPGSTAPACASWRSSCASCSMRCRTTTPSGNHARASRPTRSTAVLTRRARN